YMRHRYCADGDVYVQAGPASYKAWHTQHRYIPDVWRTWRLRTRSGTAAAGRNAADHPQRVRWRTCTDSALKLSGLSPYPHRYLQDREQASIGHGEQAHRLPEPDGK